MVKKIAALSLLTHATLGYSTVIVQGLGEESPGWESKLAGSYSETTGKTDKTVYGANYTTEFNSGANQFRSYGSVAFNDTNGQDVTDSKLIHLRYVRKNLFGPLRSEFFYQLQSNDINLVAKRELIGAGLSHRALGEQLDYHIMVGAMNEQEQHLSDSTLDRDVNRLTLSTELQWTLAGGNRFNLVIYHQPSIKELSDYRTTLEGTLVVPLSENTDVNFSYVNNMNTTPFGDIPKRSTNFETSISYSF